MYIDCSSGTHFHHHHTEEHTINGVTSGVEVINAGQRVETREKGAENQYYLEVSSIKNSLTFN